MSKVYANNIEPRNSTMDVTIGTSTNTVTLAGNDLRANTVKDSGGNTLWTSDGSGNLSSVNSALAGNLILLSTQTASAASSVSFTSDIDDTYDVYIFKFIDIHGDNNTAKFTFQANATDTADYNDINMTTTQFAAYHGEGGGGEQLSYRDGEDQAQGAAFQPLTYEMADDADACMAGTLWLFNPSNTTYVKHFYSTVNQYENSDRSWNVFTAGYFNTTSAVDDIRFKMSASTFDGIIKMYGLL